MYSLANLLAWLQCIVLQLSLVAANPAPAPAPEPLLSGLTTLIGNIGNAPPPKILWTPKPSPECAVINQGQLQCCRGALAGDQPLVVFLANLYGYRLNPDNINGLVCDDELDKCPGVKMCCQVTAMMEGPARKGELAVAFKILCDFA